MGIITIKISLHGTAVFPMNLIVIEKYLGRFSPHSPELPPGDDVPHHVCEVQYVGVLLIKLKYDGAVLAEPLYNKFDDNMNNL